MRRRPERPAAAALRQPEVGPRQFARSARASTIRVDWLYLKAGLPMEIIQEFDTWRRVRDSDGSEGWINQSLLSGKRTGIAAPWQRGKEAQIRLLDDPTACAPIAVIEPGVIGKINQCTAMVRNDFRRPYRLDQPVAGVGRLSRRIDQGLNCGASISPASPDRSNRSAQSRRVRRSRTTISTLAISMPSGGCGRLVTRTGASGMSNTRFLAFDEEMMVVGRVGVEIGLRPFDGEDAQQSGARELMQRVVDGRQRNRHAGGERLLVQLFGRQMAVALGEQHLGKRDALARRTQARHRAPACRSLLRLFVAHQILWSSASLKECRGFRAETHHASPQSQY